MKTFEIIILILIIVALASPQKIDKLVKKNIDVIDILLVLDISSSMLADDFSPNRLEVVKKTAKDFISSREGDRIGVVVFAGQSFIQCPLTTDIKVLLNLVDEISVANKDYDGTAIGMAIANATNRLRDSKSKSKTRKVTRRIAANVDGMNLVTLGKYHMINMVKKTNTKEYVSTSPDIHVNVPSKLYI